MAFAAETICVQGSNERKDPFGAISMPIYQNAAYAHPGLGKSTGYDYSRCSNPTRDEVQKTVALLEQGTEALAFSTGMAAITAMMEIFSPGDHLIATYFQKPLTLGADIVVHSGTKYLEGHNDTLSGFLVVKDNALYDQLYNIYKTTGACLSAIDSWLLLRGIKTLAVRMEQHQKNALAIAHWLEQRPEVEEVYYIGLDSRPDKELIDRQCSGYGGMISFRLNSAEKAVKILESVKLIRFAESLGGVESLLTYPMKQTHADVPVEVREALGVDEKLLRMSVGIENIDDLLADLVQAFA